MSLSKVRLEPKIDERTEVGGVQGGYAEHEGNGSHEPSDHMLTVVEFSEIHLFLNPFSQSRQCEEREESRHDQGDVKLCVSMELQRREIKGKQPFDEQPGRAEVFNTEEHPEYVHREESKNHAWYCADFFHHFSQEKLVGADEQSV